MSIKQLILSMIGHREDFSISHWRGSAKASLYTREALVSVSKNFQFTPVSCIIEETGV